MGSDDKHLQLDRWPMDTSKFAGVSHHHSPTIPSHFDNAPNLPVGQLVAMEIGNKSNNLLGRTLDDGFADAFNHVRSRTTCFVSTIPMQSWLGSLALHHLLQSP